MDLPVIAAIALSAVAALVVALLRLRGRAPKPKPAAYEPIDLLVFLSQPVKIRPGALAEGFGGRWGARVICRESPDWSDPTQKLRAYLLTDGAASLLLLVSDLPMPEDLTRPMLESQSVGAEQRRAVERHKANIRVRCVTPSERGLEPALICAKGLLTLLALPQAIGYVDIPAQLYRSKKSLGRMLDATSLDHADLFALLVNMQAAASPEGSWLHTHGMEQFGLPDIEVRFKETGRSTYYQALLTNAALYTISQGPVLKIGDTAALAGDGVMYRVRPGVDHPKHPYGPRGAIQIVKA